MFLLVACSFVFQNFLCLVYGQGQRTKELENKNLSVTKKPAELHNHPNRLFVVKQNVTQIPFQIITAAKEMRRLLLEVNGPRLQNLTITYWKNHRVQSKDVLPIPATTI